jgi:hypothetical protein
MITIGERRSKAIKGVAQLRSFFIGVFAGTFQQLGEAQNAMTGARFLVL